jgi:hypothetical protein
MLLAPVLAAQPEPEGALARLGQLVKQLSLNREACFRVRDIELRRDDVRFYFNDGWLILSRPLAGRVAAAVYVATDAGDDAEVTLRPPDLGERLSLAKHTGSPNLNEHFRNAVFVFTDEAGEQLAAQLAETQARRDPDMGAVLAEKHEPVVRNLAESFLVRIVQDLAAKSPQQGLFFAAIAGRTLGNFDLVYDPSLHEQILVGKVESTPSRPGFAVWTSFESRARRRSGDEVKPVVALEDYRIEAILEQDLRLRAITKVRVRALEPLRGALAFEIAPAMTVEQASWGGQAVEVFRRASLREGLIRGNRNEVFLIAVPGTLPAGATAELEFRHSGEVIQPAGNGVFFVGSRMNWYPGRSLDFATFDLRFQAPKALTLVATGDLVEEREDETWRYTRRRTPVPVRVAGFNVGEYERVQAEKGPYAVDVYANRRAEAALQRRPPQFVMLPPSPNRTGVPRRMPELLALPQAPPDPAARVKELASEMISAMEWMSQQFGPPPLPRLTVSPIPGFFGQGFPGLIYLSTVSYLSPGDRPASAGGSALGTFFDEILHAHELAHQWWGNLVTSATYRDDWIQEALANYSALLLLEKKKGPRSLQTVLDGYRAGLREKGPSGEPLESAGPIAWGVRLHMGGAPDPWRSIVYDKGSWIFHMLRRRMGDEAFLKMLRAIRDRFEYKDFSTDDLQALAVEFSPRGLPDAKLENFFDTWVYSTGIPTLSISTSLRGKAPALRLQVTVKQADVPEDFSIDVPVEIRVPGESRPLVKWVRTSNEPVTFTVPVKRAPARAELAPGGAVLALIR